MKISRTTLVLSGVVVLLIGLIFFGVRKYKKDLKEAQTEIRTGKIKVDSLQKVADGHYRKLVADTLKQAELNKLVAELGLKLKEKPKVVEVIKFKPRPVIDKPVDEIAVKEDSVYIEDYYPQKANYAIKYSNKFSLSKKQGLSNWDFKPIQISIVLSQRKDGIFTSDIKTPDWIEVESVDIQSTPLELYKPDNFGWIVGVGTGKDYKSHNDYMRFTGGIRFKKLYFEVGGTTEQTLDASLKVEF